jgi:hypothetical protein
MDWERPHLAVPCEMFIEVKPQREIIALSTPAGSIRGWLDTRTHT